MQQLTPAIRIHQSRLWATNTGIISGPQGSIVIDPAVFPDELEAIALAAGQVAAGFCTHAHWDHVLWHPALGEATPRFASAETVTLMEKDRERILNNLSRFEEENGAGPLWNRDLLFAEQPMVWGEGEIAGIACDLIPVPGHEHGQTALLLPDHDLCFVADTLSDIETPSLHLGSRGIAIYLQTLDRLQAVLDRVSWFVPGHGSPAERPEAQRRLDADRRYLRALAPMVNEAAAGEGTEDLARRILRTLDDDRAGSELAWSMHLDNVQQMVAEREELAAGPPTRQSSRLILLDADYRVWLLRINDPVRPRWILPGGGLEAGESWEDAARRELWEECAINDAPIGPMVATRDRLNPINGTMFHQQERYFVVHMRAQQPSIANMFAYETDDYTRQAWFSAAEIRASTEQVYPIGLADLLEDLKQGRVPETPRVWLD